VTVFVKGTKTGEVAGGAMKDLVRFCFFLYDYTVSDGFQKMALKRPNAISFSKKNVIRPFDGPSTSAAASSTSSASIASLEFWSGKNDAGFFVVGQSTKKRPNGMTFVRMYDNKVLDMMEIGITNYVGISDIKVRCLTSSFISSNSSNLLQ
jgi:ribosome production factor 2